MISFKNDYSEGAHPKPLSAPGHCNGEHREKSNDHQRKEGAGHVQSGASI